MSKEVFILTPEPPDRPGGMERFVSYLAAGLAERGFGVRIFHRENCCPPSWQRPHPRKKLKSLAAGALLGYFIGREAKRALHPGVRLVLSNSTVGWFPLGDGVKQAHFYHGTYRGQAEAIRPFITGKGYWKLKWWDAMALERWSGSGKLVFCCSELIQEEVRRFFGYQGRVLWYPLDLRHFSPRCQKACQQALGLSPVGQPVGLFVGSAHPMKNLPLVQDLCRAFPNVQWLMALRGGVPSHLRADQQLRLWEDAPYQLLPVLYGAADFAVCPSRYDPFPYVVAEALACGTPVIASPNGASWTFHRNTPLQALLTESADDRAGFERALNLVLEQPEEWRGVVKTQVRPVLETLMAPENWWERFATLTGL